MIAAANDAFSICLLDLQKDSLSPQRSVNLHFACTSRSSSASKSQEDDLDQQRHSSIVGRGRKGRRAPERRQSHFLKLKVIRVAQTPSDPCTHMGVLGIRWVTHHTKAPHHPTRNIIEAKVIFFFPFTTT